MPAALCFDAFGTLYDTDSPATELRERADAPHGVVDGVLELWRRKQLQYTYLLALMDDYRPFDVVTRESMEYALEYYGLDLSTADRDAVDAAYDALAPFPDTVPALERLASMDVELAVLSNGAPHTLEALAENADVADHFEAIVSADEVETYKPDPAVYENGAARLDRSMDECWLVTSNAWDGAGAAHAGMGVAWVNRSADPSERVGGEPTVALDSLLDLVEELE